MWKFMCSILICKYILPSSSSVIRENTLQIPQLFPSFKYQDMVKRCLLEWRCVDVTVRNGKLINLLSHLAHRISSKEPVSVTRPHFHTYINSVFGKSQTYPEVLREGRGRFSRYYITASIRHLQGLPVCLLPNRLVFKVNFDNFFWNCVCFALFRV
jgi:hypothetical protein